MPSILYINGRFISNIDELKNIFSKTIEPTSSLADEIYDAYCSGAFHSWLKEFSSDDEQMILSLLPNTSCISNSELLSELYKVLNVSCTQIIKPSFEKYARLLNIYFKVGEKDWVHIKDNIYLSSDGECRINVQLNVIEHINENYVIEIFLCNSIKKDLVCKTSVDLNSIDENILIETDPFVVEKLQIYSLEIYVDGVLIKDFPMFNGIGDFLSLTYVKGGEFWIGAQSFNKYYRNYCSNAEEINAYIFQQKKVKSFYMCKFPVTVLLWYHITGNVPEGNDITCPSLPVVNVAYDDILSFIQALNKKYGTHFRLPSEIEWEYAARGGQLTRNYDYSGSNNADDVAWFAHLVKFIQPVGQKNPNELGLYDMSGNIWELCESSFDNEIKHNRVIRGGSCMTDQGRGKVYSRSFSFLDVHSKYVGFRLVSDVEYGCPDI